MSWLLSPAELFPSGISRITSWGVAVKSYGIFQTAFPPAVEERHVSQEEQGGCIFTALAYKEKSVVSVLKKYKAFHTDQALANDICDHLFSSYADPADH